MGSEMCIRDRIRSTQYSDSVPMLLRHSEMGNFHMDRTPDAFPDQHHARHRHANGPLAITLSCKRLDAVTVMFNDHGSLGMVAFGRYLNSEVLVRSTTFSKRIGIRQLAKNEKQVPPDVGTAASMQWLSMIGISVDNSNAG